MISNEKKFRYSHRYNPYQNKTINIQKNRKGNEHKKFNDVTLDEFFLIMVKNMNDMVKKSYHMFDQKNLIILVSIINGMKPYLGKTLVYFLNQNNIKIEPSDLSNKNYRYFSFFIKNLNTNNVLFPDQDLAKIVGANDKINSHYVYNMTLFDNFWNYANLDNNDKVKHLRFTSIGTASLFDYFNIVSEFYKYILTKFLSIPDPPDNIFTTVQTVYGRPNIFPLNIKYSSIIYDAKDAIKLLHNNWESYKIQFENIINLRIDTLPVNGPAPITSLPVVEPALAVTLPVVEPTLAVTLPNTDLISKIESDEANKIITSAKIAEIKFDIKRKILENENSQVIQLLIKKLLILTDKLKQY